MEFIITISSPHTRGEYPECVRSACVVSPICAAVGDTPARGGSIARLTPTRGEHKGRSFKGRFRDFVEARPPYGLGYDPDQLPKVLQLRHPHESVPKIAYRMAQMREQVKRLLLEEIPVGTPPRGRTFTERNTRVRGTNPSVTSSDIVEYVVSRLKKDDPELADRVIRGELTSNA